VKSTLMVSHK